MKGPSLDIVVIGLSLSSSWGNGHATTFRSLLRGLHVLGHSVLFLERDLPWYADSRDLPVPDFCALQYYDGVADLTSRFAKVIRDADAVIVGSYVPQGVRVIDAVAAIRPGLLFFYDIDTPVTLAKLAQDDEEYLARRQIPLFDTYFSFSGGPVLDRLETEFGARSAVALYCSVDAGRYRATGEPIEWDLGYIGTYSPDRQPVLERLLLEPARRLPDGRFVVAGPQYPADIDWPQNVERIEHLPPAEHASFYSRQRFTLNVTRADMVEAGWSPSVRLFEAAACGTPIISDFWNGLDRLLPDGEAIVVARSADEVVWSLTGTSDARREAIARAARAIVMAEHTGVVRARQLAARIAPNLQPRTVLLSGMDGKSAEKRGASRASGKESSMHSGNGQLRTKTALVAGGAGFVGSHLCDAILAAGHRVICVDNFLTGALRNVAPLQNHPDFTLVRHDVCETLTLPRPVDWVFNLACAASPQRYQADPVHTMMTSVAGAKNLLSLAEEHGAVFLQASTSEVYGDPEEHPQREDYRGHVNCTGPRACYDEGKRAAEALCFDFLRAGRVDARVARIFNTYGPRMQADDGRIVSNLIVQALKGEPLTIYGSGEQTRSFCYVSDLVRGLIALMKAHPNPGAPVNLGNPGEFSINDLVEMVTSLVPTSSAVVYGPLPVDDPRRRRPDIGRAKRLLGWEPRVRLADGLEQTVSWFEATLGPTTARRKRPATGCNVESPALQAGE